MLQIHISEHKLGAFIEGDYHDLRVLYEALEAVVSSSCLNEMKASRNALYGMMYDIRKAMEGEREFDVFQNQLDQEILDSLSVKDDVNIYYGCYVIFPELMFILLNLHLVSKNQIDDMYYYYLRMFISLVIKAFDEEEYDSTNMDNWFKQEPTYSLEGYYHQYVDVCNLTLLDSDEETRLSLAEDYLYDLVSFNEEYEALVNEVNAYASENNCDPSEITYMDVSEDIEY